MPPSDGSIARAGASGGICRASKSPHSQQSSPQSAGAQTQPGRKDADDLRLLLDGRGKRKSRFRLLEEGDMTLIEARGLIQRGQDWLQATELLRRAAVFYENAGYRRAAKVQREEATRLQLKFGLRSLLGSQAGKTDQ